MPKKYYSKTKAKSLPSQRLLKKNYYYYPDKGLLVNKKTHSIGSIKNGYRTHILYGQTYRTHRLIWKFITGEEPGIIDHIDGNKLNNKFENLRSVTNKINARNRRKRRDNKSGYTGVHERKGKKYSRWAATVTQNHKDYNIGTFNCPTKAYVERCKFIKRNSLDFTQNHGH